MNIETFFENFQLLTDAPNAVMKLREIILQLAVRGKLVSQDSDDEPALISLNRAKRENELFQQVEIFAEDESTSFRQNKSLLATLPHGWEWVSLVEVVAKGKNSIKRGPFGSSIRKECFVPDGYKVYEQKNAIYDDLELGEYFINEEKFYELKDFELKPNDIIISCSGTIRRIAIAPQGIRRGIINQALLKITLNPNLLSNNYFKILFPAFFMNTSVLTELKGTAIKNIVGVQALKQLLFPLPPLVEQKRIVEKCDRLLSLCDQIEVRQQKRQESIVRMNESAIAQLLSSQNPDEFRQHWQRICNNFDLLYSIPETIPKLRQAILQLAVQGKLVRQDPNDEPASILLNNIQYEKEQLIKSKQIKQDKASPKIERYIVPFIIPDGWEWCYVSDISKKITDGEHLTPQRASSGYYLLSARNVRDEGIILDDVDYVPEDEFVRIRKRCDPDRGDILISCSGSVGRVAIVDRDETYVMVRSVALIKPFQAYVMSKFLAYALRSLLVQNQIIEKSKASAQANLFLGKIKELKIVLPPLAEQKRIVAKVDGLMSLCDTLEAKLKEARSHSEMLMEVAAKQVLML